MSYILHNAHWFVLLIGALVIFHELGHFVVAKACGVKVLRFSVGMGPKVVSLTRGETEYQVGLLPIGGYVKMLGEAEREGDEDGAEAASDEEAESGRSFATKPLWQRTAIILAGPAFNFLLALGVYFAMFAGTHTVGGTRLGVVVPEGPAWLAGVRPGDRVLAVDGEPVATWEALHAAISARSERPLALEVDREGARRSFHVAPDSEPPRAGERRRIGISLQTVLPMVAVPDPTSPAARAGLLDGDTLTRVDGQAVSTWWEVRRAVAAAAGGRAIDLEVSRGGQRLPAPLRLEPEPGYPPALTRSLESSADPADAYTGLVARDVQVTEVEADTPAYAAGLRAGDRLVAAGQVAPDGHAVVRPVHVWGIDLGALALGRGQRLALSWQRGRETFSANVAPAERRSVDEMREEVTSYVLGAKHDLGAVSEDKVVEHVGAVAALERAGRRVGADMTLVGGALRQLVSGNIPFRQVGGPIMLFVIAEKSAKRGWDFFARTLAMVSVNIGLMNLLPVPSLDGGHLVFLGWEAVSRRPPPMRLRELANVVGVVLLIALMVMVFRNDVLRFVF